MSRSCPVLGKKPLRGNNVSHANNKTKRFFYPNLHEVTLYSALLDRTIGVRLSSRGLRTIDKHGGVDGYVKNTPRRKLTGCFVSLAKELTRKSL